MRQITAAVFALLFTLSPAHAQRVWKTDLSHSQVKFSVTHLVIAEVTGKFNDFDVTLTQTGKDDFAGSRIDATIRMASIEPTICIKRKTGFAAYTSRCSGK